MFYRLRQTLTRFFMGRCGMDNLNRFIVIVYFVIAIINMLVARLSGIGALYFVIYLIETALLFVLVFRALSRNLYKRQSENYRFIVKRDKFMSFVKKQKMRIQYRKTHVFRNCPHCKATIKLPRRKGNHTCTCPKCRVDFPVKI